MPIVASDVTPYREAIDHGVDGCTCAGRWTTGRSVLTALLDDSVREKMAAAGRLKAGALCVQDHLASVTSSSGWVSIYVLPSGLTMSPQCATSRAGPCVWTAQARGGAGASPDDCWPRPGRGSTIGVSKGPLTRDSIPGSRIRSWHWLSAPCSLSSSPGSSCSRSYNEQITDAQPAVDETAVRGGRLDGPRP